MTETFDLSREQAQAYEDLFVPALFAQWVPTLLRHARVSGGQSVLDVACGTGIAARAAREVVGASGHVSGIDINPAMIEVARSAGPAVDWRIGDAEELPYDEGSFDTVVCQSALFFFPDPARACSEMARVLAPGGTVALQTYAGLEDQPGYAPFVDVVVHHAGAGARRLMGTYWSQGDLPGLRSLLEGAGLVPTTSETVLGHVTFPSVDVLVRTEVQATPLASRIDEATFSAIARSARGVLADHVTGGGEVRLPINARFVAGIRPL